MVAPAYTEISHFRAPYKNWPHLGVGPSVATMSGYGQDAAVAATPAALTTMPSVPTGTMFTTDANGIRVFAPAVADAVMAMMQGFSVIFLTNNAVKLDVKAPGDIRQSASDWIKQKLAEGKSIIAGSPAGVTAFVSPVVVDRTLEAVSPSAEKEKAGPGTLPLTAVLARPAGAALKAGMLGPLGMAVVALAAVGVVVYVATRKPRRAKSNPAESNPTKRNRRRRHRRR